MRFSARTGINAMPDAAANLVVDVLKGK